MFAAYLILTPSLCTADTEEISADTLMSLGAPTLAWEKISMVQSHENTLQAATIAQHRLNLLLRWGIDESRNDNGSLRLAPLNKALVEEQRLLATLGQPNSANRVQQQVLGDQIVTLSAKVTRKRDHSRPSARTTRPPSCLCERSTWRRIYAARAARKRRSQL